MSHPAGHRRRLDHVPSTIAEALLQANFDADAGTLCDLYLEIYAGVMNGFGLNCRPPKHASASARIVRCARSSSTATQVADPSDNNGRTARRITLLHIVAQSCMFSAMFSQRIVEGAGARQTRS